MAGQAEFTDQLFGKGDRGQATKSIPTYTTS
jgi:hypothetical protein